MSRTLRHPNRQTGRCRPRLERLEGRLALSLGAGPILPCSISAPPVSASETTAPLELGPFLQPVDTDPAPGSVMHGPVSSVSVGFDRPLDPFSVMVDDILIEREEDGGWFRAYDSFAPPLEELDATGTRLVLSLDTPLGPGHYRLVLPTGSSLSGLDGSMIDDPGSDQVLGEFTVVRPGVTLGDAEALPDPTAGEVVEAWGALDLADDPGAVRLYRVELPEGHHWRLGVQVDAGGLGSSLLSTLALFDAEGRVLSTTTVGRPAAPKDPYLFAGLAPGVYYLGLSGLGNVPGAAGGYDPATGSRGEGDRPDAGGSFRLNVVADPADAPTRLLGFQLDRADPRSTTPTGMTLSFSGLLDLTTLSGDPCPGLVLVGPDGQPVPMTAVRFDETSARYVFVFDRALAPGRYTVRIADEAGLADLAGWHPVAAGQPAGVLARFTVETVGPTARDPRDLGPLYVDIHDGRAFHETIAPGTAATYRFVALTEGFYVFSTQPATAGANLALRIHGPSGFSTHDASPPERPMVFLGPGSYLVQFVNLGSGPVAMSWEVRLNTPWDALLDNGVGQTPALSLRLVRADLAPGLAAPGVEPSGPSWTRGNVVMGPGSGSFAGTSDVIEPTATGAAPVDRGGAPLTTAGLVLAPVSEAVGRPSTAADRVAGPVALASLGRSVSQGMLGGQDLARRGSRPETADEAEVAPAPGEEVAEAPPAPAEDPAPAAPVDGLMAAEAPGDAARAKGDARVIATAEWLARIQESAVAFLTAQPAEAPDVDVLPAPAADGVASTQTDGRHESGKVEEATLDTPLTVAVASILAMRYHQPVLGWLRRRSGSPGRPGAGSLARFRGPHRRR